MRYSNIGEVAIKYLLSMETIYKNIKIDKYVIMPNHIHLILSITYKTKLTVGRIIKQYKQKLTKEVNQPVWQKSYYDHIIRNEKDYLRIWKYIDENVLKWDLDCYYQK